MKNPRKTKKQSAKEPEVSRQKRATIRRVAEKQMSAEKARRESEEKYQNIFKNAQVGIFRTRISDGKILESNLRLAEMYGYNSREEYIDKFLASEHYVDPGTRKRMLASFRHGRLKGFEARLTRKDGSIIWVFFSARIFSKKDYLEGVMVDITERKEMEAALRESEEKYRTLFETMVQGVAYHAADGTIVSANPPAKLILGLSLNRMQGKTFTSPHRKAIHEDGSDFPEETHPSMVALKTGKKVQDVVMGIFNPIKKRHIWLNVTAIPQFKIGERFPCQVYTIFEDITFRKESEEILRISERRFRELFNHTSSGVAVYEALADGADFLIVDLNHAGEKMEKVRKEEIIGKKVSEVFPGVREFGLLDVFQRVWRTGKTERHPVSLYKDKRIMGWKENIVYRLPSNEVVAVYEDITERKRAEEEIRTLSLTDDLTGLYNRRAFFVLAKQQLRIARRAKREMFLFYADINDLKRINDIFGHQEGDKALIDAAVVFKKTFRESDIIARIGGDEFVVLITETTIESKEVLVKRLQENLEVHNLQKNRKYRLYLSIGVAFCDPQHPRSLDNLIAQADKLMYDQKGERRKKW